MKTSPWIEVGGVLGTWIIAAIALWGEWLKSWFPFLRPDLRIELVGLKGPVRQNNGRMTYYYHVRVKNVRSRRFPPAHQVRLLITRVEKPDASGQPTVEFPEPLQLTWVRQETLPLALDIGPEADAALLFVGDDGAFSFTPLVFPNHFPAERQGRADFWVTLEARSIEVDSEPVRLKIAWDGQWNPGEREIARSVTTR
jgi:hypothetical protein